VGPVAPERERCRRYCFCSGDAIPLDAGDLYKAANGIAGHPEMMLKCDFGCVLYLRGSAAKSCT
jgi:hypothetical protein